MKPIVIYSMPRSKSTAALEAARRETLLNEPFSANTLIGKQQMGVMDKFQFMLEYPGWDTLYKEMSQPNTASKFFGSCIHSMPKAKDWFKQIDDDQSHEIFCLIRSPRETILSHVLAMFFGFYKGEEKENAEIEIDDKQLISIHEFSISLFLKYYPKNASTVTFESLPSEHFDLNKVFISNQHSIERRKHCVSNFDELERKIDLILRYHEKEWYEKTGTDIFF